MSREPLSNQHKDARSYLLFPSLQQEISPVLDTFISDIPIRVSHAVPVFVGTRFPTIDLMENSDALVMSAEVPGLEIENLEVTISDDVLTLKGEKHPDLEEAAPNYHLSERWFGRFFRQVQLGFIPHEDAVAAIFADGVLTLTITKPNGVRVGSQKVDIKIT